MANEVIDRNHPRIQALRKQWLDHLHDGAPPEASSGPPPVRKGAPAASDGHDDLVTHSLDHAAIWAKWNKTGGAIQRVVPKSEESAS